MNREQFIERLVTTTSAFALAVGLGTGAAAAANITITGTTVGPQTNSGALDFILIQPGGEGPQGAIVNGNITNTSTGVIGTSALTSTPVTIDGRTLHALAPTTINGSIVNNGTITAAHTIEAVFIGDTAVSGGLSNSGTITNSSGGGTSNHAIDILSSSVNFSGGLTNSGLIQSTVNGASHGGVVNIVVPNFSSGITNSGTIAASGLTTGGAEDGIVLGGATFSGGVSNSGTISLATTNGGRGLFIGNGTFMGGINNSGGGLISVTSVNAQADGIFLEGGLFSGGITNSGRITSTNTGVDGSAFGITNDSTTFTGGITNSGTITASSPVSGAGGASGISLFGSLFSGGIANSGLITAGSTSHARGISISASTSGSSFFDGINNQAGGRITATASAQDALGISADIPTFTGGITNAGTVTALGQRNALGIEIGDVPNFGSGGGGEGSRLAGPSMTFIGGITNSGTVSAMGTTNGAGAITIGANVVTFAGGITNSSTGLISASGGTLAVGVYTGSTLFTGDIANAGKITASSAAKGSEAGIYITAKTFAGNITNSGTIAATGGSVGTGKIVTGIHIGTSNGTSFNAGFLGSIANSGTISASGATPAVGIGIQDVWNFTLGINNQAGGLISASSTGGSATGIGISNSTFTGGITNAGTISSSGLTSAGGLRIGGGLGLTNNAAAVNRQTIFSGGITNSGKITATATGADSMATGIAVQGQTFTSGNIVNNGTISASGVGLVLGLAVGRPVTTTNAHAGLGTFVGNITNSGLISAVSSASRASALSVEARTFTGSITNSGTITASGSEHANGLSIGGWNDGIWEGRVRNVDSFTGGVVNSASGLISATSTNSMAMAMVLQVATFGGGITNAGTINAHGSCARGLCGGDSVSRFTGGIQNSGYIGATGSASSATALFIGATSFAGGISNSGTISASGFTCAAAIDLAGNGVRFDGGITNTATGLITATSASSSATAIRVAVSSFTGGIVNAGRILASSTNSAAIGIFVNVGSIFTGGITNSGTISGAGKTTGIGLQIIGGTFFGGITNSGTIIGTATGVGASGIGIASSIPIGGGITNAGTITGATASIDLTVSPRGGGGGGETLDVETVTVSDGGTTINQNGGAILGSVKLSTGGDVFNINGGTVFSAAMPGSITNASSTGIVNLSGGTLFLSKNSSVGTSGTPISSFSHTSGTLQLQVDAAVTPTTIVGPGISPSAGSAPWTYIFANNATLNGTSAIQAVTLPDFYGNTQTYVVVNSANTIVGNTATASVTTPLLTASTSTNSGTKEILTLTRVPFASVAGLTTAEQTIAASLETSYQTGSAGAKTQLSPLFGDNLAQYKAYLDALNPNNPSVTTHSVLAFVDNFVSTVENRLAGGAGYDGAAVQSAALRNGSFRVAAAGNNTTSDAGNQQVAQIVPDSQPSGQTGVWMRGYGIFADADNKGGTPGYSETKGGVIGGVDYMVAPTLRLGGAVNYGHTNVTFNQSAGTLKLDSYQGAVYANYQPGAWYVNGIGTVGWSNYGGARNAAGSGIATSNFDGKVYSAYGETGYDFKAGGFALRPLAGVQYTRTEQDSYTETGAGAANLVVHGATNDSVVSSLGMRAQFRLPLDGAGVLVPEIRAIWQHEFGDAGQNVTAASALTPNSPFTVTGAAYSRDAVVVGIGATLELSRSSKLFVDYDGKFSSDYKAHAVSAGFRFQF